jgi:hypothetical protein
MSLNITIGFFATLVASLPLIAYVAGTGALIELGLMLVAGGCLMSRQPLQESGRYNEDGTATSAWKMAVIGRRLLLGALILLLYSMIIGLVSIYLVF